ncbi:MAG TPA: LPS assembly lipoprotein LptE [Ignavibacteria bacterium]|nr:LPS assembly lipoprotein LptE [Ignavibacteria bacterium]
MKRYVLLILLSLMVFSGCNYGFRGKNPPPGISTLNIPLFENTSGFAESDIREKFTESLKNKIVSDNTFLLTDKEQADGMLTCNIATVTDEPLVISGNEQVSKRKITITISVDFQNLKTTKQIWQRNFVNYGEYNSSSGSFSERLVGVNEAIEKITEDIINDLTSNW